MNISFSTSAIEDLENIQQYYLEQGAPKVGQKFIAEIIKHIETLSTHPDVDRVVPEFNDALISELIHSPFRVVYLRESKSINIIRVWRSEKLLNLPEL